MYASPAAAEPHCGFEANPDLYGLGIRIGVYLQSFACIFLNVIREQASHSILTAGNLLYLAILTALIVLICRDESFEVTEAYIVLVFLSTIPGKYLQRLEVQQIGWSGRHITRAVVNDFLGVLDVIARLMKRGVAIWFWWKGIDVLVNSPCTGYGFFFSKVLLDGWYRTLMKVLSIIDVLPALAFAGQLLLGYPPVIRKALLKSLGSVERVYHVMFVYNIVMFVVHVVATELTVRWNHIGGKTDVAAIDQFIPLIVGIGSCIAVIPELGHKIRNSKGSIATIFGPPLRPALLPLLSPTPPPSLSSAGSQDSWSDRSDEHRVPDTGTDMWSTLIAVLEELAMQSNPEMTSGEKEYLQYQLQVARIARTRFTTGRLESRKTRQLDDAIEGIRVVLRAGSLSEYELPTVGMLSAARVKWDSR